jgi:hypothetical protein
MSVPPTKDPALADHLAWLGYIQPEGLVVSAPALVDAQVVIDRAGLSELQRRLAPFVSNLALTDSDTGDTAGGVAEIPRFLIDYLGWPTDLLVGWDATRPLPPELTVALPEFGETLTPTYAVSQPKAGASPWLLLVKTHPATTDLDKPASSHERGWPASPAKKFERLLRETQVPIGLLSNGVTFRLVYAPPKENSGALTFPVAAMTEISGRLILGAFHLLLNSLTLFNAPSEARLPAILQRSRDYQASVSEKLAEQVLHALYELLRGFEAADSQAKGKLLRKLAIKHPEDIYGGLVTVLLRLVFVLFAEDRGLLPMSGLYVNHYSVRGLFERLRADAERHPDTMDLRYGAWAQLLALFRLIHGGCKHSELTMPAREGHLFDPQRFPFLEGRASRSDPIGALPLVSDGTLHRILEKLCILGGERVSYRTLDVEEIGSVYQTIMGFGVETAVGTAISLKGKRKNGGVPASPVISLDLLLAIPAKDRTKWIKENADTEMTGEADKRLKTAATVDDLLVALEKRIDRHATPAPVANGGLVLQPGDERRRSGSHYTPRSFTQPIVRKTLEPILQRFGEQPTPTQILELKICDIAVGSAAFLVETCRQLADVLIRAWRVHGGRPVLPPDETEELLAMRTIAQRCLYGVDRNPMAVDLAKLSLWLATLAKEHPFTFLDHTIRAGDSLVGLTAKQIAAFTWGPTAGVQRLLGQDRLEKRLAAATAYRREILEAGDLLLPALKTQKLVLADEALNEIRFVGDLAIAAFFGAEKDKARRDLREDLLHEYAATTCDISGRMELKNAIVTLRGGQFPITPFHWEIEYPEVFDRENPGFDGIVGNPPFAGKNTLLNGNRSGYLDWIMLLHPESHGNADLVAHFFRSAFNNLRDDGTFGLIATNTIGQGDTRASGLRWICKNGGTIYAARKRYKWPGQAAVVVSVVWAAKGKMPVPFDLDGRPVALITAYLFHAGGHETPAVLLSNQDQSFQGSIVLGMGFTFDDTDTSGATNSVADLHALLKRNTSNGDRIFPFIGGEEVCDSPIHAYHRFVINFFDFPLRREALNGASWFRGDEREREGWLRTGIVPKDYPYPVAADWPDLLQIVKERVKPERDIQKRDALRDRWWQFAEKRPGLVRATQGLQRMMVNPLYGSHLSFIFMSPRLVASNKLNVLPFERWNEFGVLQSRCHEVWARFFSSTLKDDLAYTPTDCFETFPFPTGVGENPALEASGREYYEFRAALMQDLWLGLTEIYNLFHAPDGEAQARLESLYRKRSATGDWRTIEAVPVDRSALTLYATPASALIAVQRLRALHAAMDIAVLTAYGWTDLLPKCTCEFFLEYEDDGSSAEEATGRQRKKPWRFRWPDEVRDEVLARLLRLNAERAEQERLAGLATSPAKPAKKASGAKPVRKPKPATAVAAPVTRQLPTDLRLAENDGAIYAVGLVVALLSEAGGTLPWPRLLDAFALATQPDQLKRFAEPEYEAAAKEWASTWNEETKPQDLLSALENLTDANISVTRSLLGFEFALQDGPRRLPPHLAYDAWLALRVAESLPPSTALIPSKQRNAFNAKMESVVA